MADSKKKKTGAKKGGAPQRTAGAKPTPKAKAAPSARKAVKAPAPPPARRERPAEAPGTPSRTAALERELSEARNRIRQLEEEHDAMALFEEEPDLQKQLDDAKDEIRSLRSQLEQSQRARAAGKGSGEMVEIEFDEEAEEEEAPAAAEEIDDVEAIYDRMDDPRVRRRELDRERIDRESEAGDEPYWMVCPKCGDSIEEIESEDVKLDRCENCGGIYLDRGEVEMLLSLSRGREGLRRVRNVLSL
jgi:hypothetical protein